MIIIYKEGNLLIQDTFLTRSVKYGMATSPLPNPYFDIYRGSLIVPLSPDFLTHPTEYTVNHPDHKHSVKQNVPLFNYNGLQLAEFTANNIKLHFTSQDKETIDEDLSATPPYYVVTYPYYSLLNHSEFAFTSNFNIRSELNILMFGDTKFDKLKEWVYTTSEHVEGYLVTVSKKKMTLGIRDMLYKITIDKPKDMDDTLFDFIREQSARVREGLIDDFDGRTMEVINMVNGVILKMISTISRDPIMLPVYGDVNVEDKDC